MEIRDATEADLPEIVGIYNSTVPPLRNVAVESRKAWLREHGGRRLVWVAEEGGEILGWLALSDFENGRTAYRTTAEVGAYVKEGRRGTGRFLLSEAIRRSPGLGLKTLTAGAFGRNEPSLRLFEGFGFERWAFYPRVAELDGVGRDLVVLR